MLYLYFETPPEAGGSKEYSIQISSLLRMYYGFGKSQILSNRKVKESKVDLLWVMCVLFIFYLGKYR